MTLNNIPRPYVIVIVIILAGIFSLFLGVIIGNLTHLVSGDKDSGKKDVESEFVDKTIESEEVVPEEKSAIELYEVFLLMSIDPDVINQTGNMLKEEGFKIKVISILKAGKKIYFLKLDALYKKENAEALGNDIKLLYPEFSGYWLEKVIIEREPDIKLKEIEQETSTDKIEPVVTESVQEKIKKAADRGVDLYEMQVLANTDKSKIKEKSDLLKKYGYRTKITTARVNDILYYRLRIDSLYTLTAGQKAGEKLKLQFDFIEGYWLEKIKKSQ